MFESIAPTPVPSQPHRALTHLLGTQTRSHRCRLYRIDYRFDGPRPEIIAILHRAHDADSQLATRFPGSAPNLTPASGSTAA